MALARIKTWIAGEVLTAAALNAEFDNITDNFLSPTANETITGAWTFPNGVTINGTLTLGSALPVASGGTGATTAAAARTALAVPGLGENNSWGAFNQDFQGNTRIANDGKVRFGKAVFWNSTTALTDGANIAWNLDNPNIAAVTLEGNRTLDNPSNKRRGTFILMVTQDGTGSRTLDYDTDYLWPGGTAPTLSTDPNAVDILTFVCDGTNMFGVSLLDFS